MPSELTRTEMLIVLHTRLFQSFLSGKSSPDTVASYISGAKFIIEALKMNGQEELANAQLRLAARVLQSRSSAAAMDETSFQLDQFVAADSPPFSLDIFKGITDSEMTEQDITNLFEKPCLPIHSKKQIDAARPPMTKGSREFIRSQRNPGSHLGFYRKMEWLDRIKANSKAG